MALCNVATWFPILKLWQISSRSPPPPSPGKQPLPDIALNKESYMFYRIDAIKQNTKQVVAETHGRIK